jgi:hypothetical protein
MKTFATIDPVDGIRLRHPLTASCLCTKNEQGYRFSRALALDGLPKGLYASRTEAAIADPSRTLQWITIDSDPFAFCILDDGEPLGTHLVPGEITAAPQGSGTESYFRAVDTRIDDARVKRRR